MIVLACEGDMGVSYREERVCGCGCECLVEVSNAAEAGEKGRALQ